MTHDQLTQPQIATERHGSRHAEGASPRWVARVPLRRVLLATATSLVVLAFLQWGVPALGVPPYILPTPTNVVASLFNLEYRLWYHLGITAFEGISGLVLGGLAGYLLAVLFVHVPVLEDAIYPWLIVFQTIPLVALAPLLIIWFGNDLPPRIAMAAIFAFFPVLINSVRGLRDVQPAAFDLLRSYGAGRQHVFTVLRLPASLPFLLTGLKISATLAMIGAMVGELAGADKGLGYVIVISTYYLDTSRAFAAIACASAISIGLYLVLLVLERYVVFWRRTA